MDSDIDFKLVWRFLRREHWKALPSRGLGYGHDYIKPGCSRKTGEHGMDYFSSEQGLLDYIRSDKDLCGRVFPEEEPGLPAQDSSRTKRMREGAAQPVSTSPRPKRTRKERNSCAARSDNLLSDSNSEYTPDANEEEEPDEAVATTSSPTTATDSSLRPSRSFSSTMYASHRLDPNLFTSDGDPSLESDEEAASEAEDALDDASSSEEDEDEQVDEALPDELAEMTAALDLEKRVRDSSALYGDAELRKMATDGWNVLPENTVTEVDSTADVGALYSGYCGQSNAIMERGLNILELFFFFLPKTMWQHIASESHRYWEPTLDDRVEKAFIAQPPATEESQRPPSSRERIRAKLNKFQKVQPHELLYWVGLLVARMMAPKKRLADHWSGIRRGVIPQGTFGRVMARDRFKDITRFLHFSNNQDELAKIDRAWKLRPVLATVERTFPAGYILGSRISIDEGMLPCKNRHNPTRTYLKDKPHKWGSKYVEQRRGVLHLLHRLLTSISARIRRRTNSAKLRAHTGR
ncbi:hypothetical protein PR003_g10746 [Phytophthora rubi]|uniref:PiggyBac transposable element-derived protein domain-containing protein n=1 Tax=Phytophthora rubi TaxID=129364 RepID=A0A6A4FCV4_9STRA|nr:hypothetical protein PR003_g10746 [Phytophthora rubi]